MPKARRCLDADVLNRLQRGEVSSHDLEAVGEHLLLCRRCAEAAGSLVADDPLTVAARAGDVATNDMDRSHIAGLIHGCATRPGLNPPETEYSFLAPAQSVEEMGRLGPYRVLGVLGSGGMGVVFWAEDEQLRRPVALKVMRPELAAKPSARQRFLREAQTAAALEHDHIVSIFQVGEDRGVPFLAMPLLKGESLEDRLKREGSLPPAEVLRIGREIAEGLAAAHEHGLIHRDVKPANVWLENGAGRVKLLDFGLARPVADDAHLTQEGIVAGTPHYMAPEQAEGKPVDARCDLFSLGCVLYRMVTGRLPFPGASTMAVLRLLALAKPKSPRQVNPVLPQGLSDLTMKLLAGHPEGRPRSAATVVEAITALEHQPAAQKHRRRLFTTVAASVLFFGVLAGLATLFIRTPDGTLVVEIDDPQVKVTVEAEGGLAITGAGPQEVRLRPGSYRWLATKDGKPVKSDVVTITRGGKQVVRVTLEAEAPAFAFKPAPPGPLDKLDPANIPAEERFAWQPKELVQVLGEHAGRHWGLAVCAVFRPDGKLIASGGAGGEIGLWDAQTLRERAVLTGHTGWVRSLAFSPDGKLLLSGGDDRLLRLWDVEARKELKALPGHTAITTGVAFAADAKRAISCGGNGDSSVRLWDLETGKELLSCPGHRGGVNGVAISPDGKRALSGGNDRVVRLWDLTTGKELRSFEGHTDGVKAVALSPDGHLALSCGGAKDPTVRLWEVETRRERHVFRGQTHNVHSVAFSPDGCRALSSEEGRDHAGWLWDVETGKELRRLDSVGSYSVAFSPDGHRAVFANHGLGLWDLDTGKELCPRQGHPSWARGVAFSPDGRHVLSCSQGDRTVWLWDVGSGKGRRLEGHTAVVHAVAFSPDGKQALSGGQDKVMRLWDVDSGTERRQFEGDTWINTVAFSPDGQLALSSGGTGTRLWDVPGGRELRCLADAEGRTWGATFSPTGRRVLSVRQHDSVLVWDVKSGQELQRYTAPDAANFGVVVAPDSRSAFSAGLGGTLRRWDLDTAEPRHRTFMKWHTDHVRGLALSPDGKTLASSGKDGRVILWEAATGTKLREWRLPGVVAGVAFAPDGQHLATANANGSVYILRLGVPESTK